MNTYSNTDGILIASAECEKTYGPVKSGDGTGAALCNSYGVKGFPDIRYGDPSNLTKYEGERDYASLLAFAQKNLGPSAQGSPVHWAATAPTCLKHSDIAV